MGKEMPQRDLVATVLRELGEDRSDSGAERNFASLDGRHARRGPVQLGYGGERPKRFGIRGLTRIGQANITFADNLAATGDYQTSASHTIRDETVEQCPDRREIKVSLHFPAHPNIPIPGQLCEDLGERVGGTFSAG